MTPILLIFFPHLLSYQWCSKLLQDKTMLFLLNPCYDSMKCKLLWKTFKNLNKELKNSQNFVPNWNTDIQRQNEAMFYRGVKKQQSETKAMLTWLLFRGSAGAITSLHLPPAPPPRTQLSRGEGFPLMKPIKIDSVVKRISDDDGNVTWGYHDYHDYEGA